MHPIIAAMLAAGSNTAPLSSSGLILLLLLEG